MTGHPDDPFPPIDSPTEVVLQEALTHHQGVHVALLDGALYDGLPGLMHAHGLRGRGLFIGAEHREIVAAGPALITLDKPETCDRLIALMGMARAPLIWSWPEGEQALFDHLRRHTHVEVPDDDLWPSPDPHYVQVLFRHWDADVMALNLQVMTPYQKRRMVPSGTAVTVISDLYGGLQRFTSDTGPLPPPLPLARRLMRFEQDQMDRMDDLIAASYHPEVLADLKDLFPPGTELPPERALKRAVEDGDWLAGDWGITDHGGVVFLCFWLLAFGRKSREFKALEDEVHDPDDTGTADERLIRFMTRYDQTGEI